MMHDEKALSRRRVLQMGMTGVAVLSLVDFGCSGSHGSSGGYVGHEFDLTIGAALFEMVDGKEVFMWAFQDPAKGPHMPGPVIKVDRTEPVRLHLTNSLLEAHAFAIPGVVDSGPIAPGQTAVVTFTPPAPGTYLYFDPLNAPVNRLLGLHGAFIVEATTGNTPYEPPTPAVQQLFDDLGTTAHFPKNVNFPAGWQRERDRIWLHHQIDPRFHAQARADFEAGRPGSVVASELSAGFLPRYFTINGRSGVFAATDHDTVIEGRLGEPMLVRILNAGLYTHSDHLHANHFYVTAVNGTVQDNVFFLDTLSIYPGDRVDWLVPFERPPDIPGDPSVPLHTLIHEELALVLGEVRQSPLAYPMHCHMETSQTAAGGNYPQGAVTHFDILGDLDGVDFPTHV